MDIQYRFTITKNICGKRQESYIELSFKESNFHHLVGLHKLKGVDKVKVRGRSRKRAQDIYDGILGGHITFYDLDKDTPQHKAAFMSRATSLNLISTMMDNINVNLKGLYRFDNRKIGSKIKAKYLLHFRNRDKEFYFFFDKDVKEEKTKNTVKCHPVSVFRKKVQSELKENQQPKHYELRQEHIVLSKVEKIQGSDSTVLYEKVTT